MKQALRNIISHWINRNQDTEDLLLICHNQDAEDLLFHLDRVGLTGPFYYEFKFLIMPYRFTVFEQNILTFNFLF